MLNQIMIYTCMFFSMLSVSVRADHQKDSDYHSYLEDDEDYKDEDYDDDDEDDDFGFAHGYYHQNYDDYDDEDDEDEED